MEIVVGMIKDYVQQIAAMDFSFSIHLCIEFYFSETQEYRAYATNVECEIDLELFPLLAGMAPNTEAVFPNRGFPDDASDQTRYQYFRPIIDSDFESLSFWRGFDFILKSVLDSLKNSTPIHDADSLNLLPCPYGYIVDPSFHSASFLSPQEISIDLEKYSIRPLELFSTSHEVLKKLFSQFGKSRMVFWFDDMN